MIFKAKQALKRQCFEKLVSLPALIFMALMNEFAEILQTSGSFKGCNFILFSISAANKTVYGEALFF